MSFKREDGENMDVGEAKDRNHENIDLDLPDEKGDSFPPGSLLPDENLQHVPHITLSKAEDSVVPCVVSRGHMEFSPKKHQTTEILQLENDNDKYQENDDISIEDNEDFGNLVNLPKELKTLADTDDPDELIIEIYKDIQKFQHYLEIEKVTMAEFYCMIKIIFTVANCSNIENKRKVFTLIGPNYLGTIHCILNEVLLEMESTSSVWKDKLKLNELCWMLVVFMKQLIHSCHGSFLKCKKIIDDIKVIGQKFPNTFDMTTEKELDTLVSLMDLVKQARTTNDTSLSQDEVEKRSDGSFRTLSILPTLSELKDKTKSYLTPNKERGPFENLEVYLDTHFRLLREDFIRPLKAGFSQYRDRTHRKATLKGIREVRIYNAVRFLGPLYTHSGINHKLKFNRNSFSKKDLSMSKYLLHGSLVCLSEDNFETYVLATVTGRDLINNGKIEIRLEEDDILRIHTNTQYTMLESTSFFEAYRHVLYGLQKIDDLGSFTDYFIHSKSDVKHPGYLEPSSYPVYDFGCFFEDNDKFNQKHSHKFHVLIENSWPSKDELGLDKLQYEAMKMAITKELAVIQGPPGTGKTYIGLQVVKLLIENHNIWNKKEHCAPILVVCHTNHALDQFLEGIHSFCRSGIVRVGSRSKSKVLEQFFLSNVRRNRFKKKTYAKKQQDFSIKTLALAKSKVNKFKFKFMSANELFTVIPYVHRESFLKNVMVKGDGDGHYDHCYEEKHDNDEEKQLLLWLGIDCIENKFLGQMSKIPNSAKIRLQWEQYIVDDAKELTYKGTIEVWSLSLLQRAMIYKRWIKEAIAALDRKISDAKRKKVFSKDKLQNVLKLEGKLIALKTTVVNAAEFLNDVSKQKTKQEIKMCRKNGNKSLKDSFDEWLALNESEISTCSITESRNIECYNNAGIDVDRMVNDDYTFYGADKKWYKNYLRIRTSNAMNILLTDVDIMNENDANSVVDVWSLTYSKRFSLYKYWIHLYKKQMQENVQKLENGFETLTHEVQKERKEQSITVLKQATVIGMTTTAAATNRDILQSVNAKIIIVEEAAEVLESHVLSSMSKGCQHLILIGDHKQLRPTTTVYDLAIKYKLDVSMFERLINNNVPHVTLSVQRRMRPEISDMLRYRTLYPHLMDHSSVLMYDDVLGIDGNFLFINHEFKEKRNPGSLSYTNEHEADYVIALCNYILMQGYFPKQVTILSPYIGQVLLLKETAKKKNVAEVYITATDNYQGEENDIILLSLVRSNNLHRGEHKRNPIGFLKVENRICVAMSRAKKGLYVIGNFELLRSASPLWHSMVSKMEGNKRLTNAITLRCQIHPEKTKDVSRFEDFLEVSEGGCDKLCGQVLSCNHKCSKTCHIKDREHTSYRCTEPCQRNCKRGHTCNKECWEDCECDVQVETKLELCGHLISFPCHLDEIKCNMQCEIVMSCGHTCGKTCSDCTFSSGHIDKCNEELTVELSCGHVKKYACSEGKSFLTCSEHVDKTLPCNHKYQLRCSGAVVEHLSVGAKSVSILDKIPPSNQENGIAVEEILCSVKCDQKLSCGHRCKGSCFQCYNGRIHVGCKEICSKVLKCGHTCTSVCGTDCPPCQLQCQRKCSHGIRCQKKCSEICTDCRKICEFKCKHKKCTGMCSQFCKDIRCNKKCTRRLTCGHFCRSFCGEICVCLACCSIHSIRHINAHEKEQSDKKFMLLPDCSCIVEASKLDIALDRPQSWSYFKRCPYLDCRKHIFSGIKRYSNILKQNQINIVEIDKDEFENSTIRISDSINTLRADSSLETTLNDQFKTQQNGFVNFSMKLTLMKRIIQLKKECEHLKIIFVKSNFLSVLSPEALEIELMKDRPIPKQFLIEAEHELRRLNWFIDLHNIVKLSIGGKIIKYKHIFTSGLKNTACLLDDSALFKQESFLKIPEILTRLKTIATQQNKTIQKAKLAIFPEISKLEKENEKGRVSLSKSCETMIKHIWK